MADEPKKKFYDDINEQLHTVVKELMAEHPELEGVAMAVVYDPALGDLPPGLVFGNLQKPEYLCQVGVQVAKLQAMIAGGVSMHFAEAGAAIQQEKKDIDGEEGDNGNQGSA